MEEATLKTWLMLLNKPRRKFSSLIGGKNQTDLDMLILYVICTYETYFL